LFDVVANAASGTISGIPPGDYTVSITATGPGGSATIAGNPISILGVAGGGEPSTANAGDTPADPTPTDPPPTTVTVKLENDTGTVQQNTCSGGQIRLATHYHTAPAPRSRTVYL
jgi:hypothetical protein